MIRRAKLPVSMTPPKPARFDQKTVGRRIRDARRTAGYTAEQLGAKVGIGPDAMLKKEKGVAPFFLDELSRICDLLDAPRLFPFLEWDAARLVDRLLSGDKNGHK